MARRIVSVFSAAALALYSSAVAGGEEPLAENAKITVLTNGSICAVYIDGEEAGQSPVSVLVTPGKHTVKVVAASGEAKEKTITARANDTHVVRFSFPLPKPVEAAHKGDYGKESEWSLERIGLGLAGICVLGGAIILAYNYGYSGGLSGVRVSQQNIDLSVESNLDPADDDRIDLIVNGTKWLDDYDLSGGGQLVNVTLESGRNFVEIVAKNEGTTPPNTGTLTISHVSEGDSTQQWSLSSGSTARLTIIAP